MHLLTHSLTHSFIHSFIHSFTHSLHKILHRGASRGLFPYFFGEDGKKRMQLKSFDDFLKGLHDEIVRLEFAHYDYKNQVSKLLLPCCIVIAVGGSLIGTDGDVTNFVQ